MRTRVCLLIVVVAVVLLVGMPASAQILYENGPINGETDGWTINFGFVISDTFTISTGSSTVTGLAFGAWLMPGDVLESAEVTISTQEVGGGTVYFDQVVNFTASNCFTNNYGYNVCTETGNFAVSGLNVGPYWVNLQNAVVNNGDPVYWDENSGAGCNSPGCPSQADENLVGTIPSEAFSLSGGGPPPPPPCFQPRGNLQVIHDFTAQESSASGVSIDSAGNLYGAAPTGGAHGTGLIFELARWRDWMFDFLYTFPLGGDGHPTEVLQGPDGSLYGAAAYAGTECSAGHGETVFDLKPSPNACQTPFCQWTENVLHRFCTAQYTMFDVSGFDRGGNLYGTSYYGGVYGHGSVYKLTRSGGAWTAEILYSFTGGSDGAFPSKVIPSPDGNIYGIAQGGAYGDGVVFQLAPAGSVWKETVLHSFQWGTDGGYPSYLFQDRAGNLYGIASWFSVGPLFILEKTDHGWVFNEYLIYHPGAGYVVLQNLAMDGNGNLYGTGQGGPGCSGPQCSSSDQNGPYWFIYKASFNNDVWQYQDLMYVENQQFPSTGPLAVDPQGNLYGTTSGCGRYGEGTVWQLSP